LSLHWEENAIVNVKLQDNMYTLAQLYQEPYLQLFKISNNTGKWGALNLNEIESHIFVYSDSTFYKERFIEKLNNFVPIEICPPKYAINTSILTGKCLVEPRFKGKQKLYETFNSKIIKKALDPIHDEEIIRQYELIHMEPNYNLTTRLIYFYETGVDVDLGKLYEFYPDEFNKYLNIFQNRFQINWHEY